MGLTITEDVQFMTNIVSAQPIPVAGSYHVVNDHNGEPAIFSLVVDAITHHKTLHGVIMTNGVPTLYDYSKIITGFLGPGTEAVQAFHVTQDAFGTVFIAVAYDTPTSGSGRSNVMVMSCNPAKLGHTPSTYGWIFGLEPVTEIFMSSFSQPISPGSRYKMPRVLLGFAERNSINSTDQLGWLTFSPPSSSFMAGTLNRSWKLLTEIDGIYDVAFLNTGEDHTGVAVLYKGDNGTGLQYAAFEGGSGVQLQCSAQATSLTSFYDTNSQTSSLIVGGDTLTLLTHSDYTRTSAAGIPIDNSIKLPSMIKAMHCAQANGELCIWYTTANDAVYYYSAITSSISSGSQVPFLPAGTANTISGLLSLRSTNSTRVDSILSTDIEGNIVIVQKSTDTGIWSKRAYWMASEGAENLDVPSFTIRLAAKSDDPTIHVANCKLHIKSLDLVSATINGVQTSIVPAGDWYQADAHGSITLIVSTDDMSTHAMTVDGFQPLSGSEQTLSPPIELDPSGKMHAVLTTKLKEVWSNQDGDLTSQDLLKLKRQSDGTPVISSANLGDTTFADSAAKALGQLATIKPIPKSQLNLKANQGSSTSDGPGSIIDFGWEVFHLIENATDAVVKLTVEIAENAAYLAVHFANDVYNFALNTYTQITKGLAYVFNKIKVFVTDLIDLIGFLFEWDDILDTADSIATILHTGLQYTRTKTDDAGNAANNFLDNLKGHVDTASKNKPPNQQSGSGTQNKQSDANSTQQGAHYNWASYQLSHGGASQSTFAVNSPTQDFTNMFNAVMKEKDTFTTFMGNLQTDIGNLFTSGTDTDAVFKKLGTDVVDLLVNSLKNLVTFFVSGVDAVLDLMKDTLTTTITIPIFSPIWNKFTGGRDFTVLNCISLILAVPTCVLYKVGAKASKNLAKTLPKLKNSLTTPEQFGLVISGDPSVAQLSSDVALIMAAAAPAVTVLAAVVTVLSQAIDEVTEPMALESSGNPNDTNDTMQLGGAWLGKDQIIDLLSLAFTAFGVFESWPTNSKDNADDLRKAAFSLKLTSGAISGLAYLLGGLSSIPRAQIQRIVGPMKAVIAIPVFFLDEATLAIMLANNEVKDGWLCVNKIITELFVVVSALSKGVTSFLDGEKDLVSISAFGIAELVYYMGMSCSGVMEAELFWEVHVAGNK